MASQSTQPTYVSFRDIATGKRVLATPTPEGRWLVAGVPGELTAREFESNYEMVLTPRRPQETGEASLNSPTVQRAQKNIDAGGSSTSTAAARYPTQPPSFEWLRIPHSEQTSHAHQPQSPTVAADDKLNRDGSRSAT